MGSDLIMRDSPVLLPESSYNETPSPQGFDDFLGSTVVETLTKLVRRQRLIVAVAAIALLAGIVTSYLLPVRYTASTAIMPPRQTQSTATLIMSQLAGDAAGPLAAVAGGSLGLRNPDDIYIDLLKSRPVADAIISQFGLAHEYHAKDATGARLKLAKHTSIVSEKSELINVSVTDRDRSRAAAMANAYVDQLRLLTRTLAVSEASQRRLFYEDQLKHAKDDLIAAELSYLQVQQKKGLVQPDAQAKAMIEGLANLRAEIAAKEVQVQALRSYSTDHNPEVQLAEHELDSLRSEASRMEEHSSSSSLANLGLLDVPSAGLEYLRASHEMTYRQTLYDLLIKQYDSARLDESKDATVIQVVEPAIPPDRRSSPHRSLIIILFAALGFAGACSYVLLLDVIATNPGLANKLKELRSAIFRKATSQA